MTPSATMRGSRVPAARTREHIIERLRRYHALYGELTAACFAPSAAKLAGRQDLIERYYQGDPGTGEPWPSLNTIKSRFDDSFTVARAAAGLPENKRGPRRRGPGELAPIRESHVGATRLVYVEKRGVSRELAAAVARADRAEAALERLRANPKVKTATNAAALQAARERAREARDKATRLAARLERAEATINTLRGKLRERDAEYADLFSTAARLQALVDAARENVREVIVEVPVERVVTRVVQRPAPAEAVVQAAQLGERQAVARQRAAESRARDAQAAYMELVEAVAGSRRQLTPGELRQLKRRGPAGDQVLAGALKQLAKARRQGGRAALAAALTEVAAAAASWKDRL